LTRLVREATFQEQHSSTVQKGIKLGVILFIVSEVMFFFGFFWAFFHSSIAPAFNIGGVWPPKAISIISTFALPFLNTVLLLTSGASITWGHHAVSAKTKNHSLSGLLYTVGFATLFTMVQGREYTDSPFNISDGVYGSCFYMTTGFHGFHGASFSYFRVSRNFLSREYLSYLVKRLTYLKSKDLRKFSMLVKVKHILVKLIGF
jgi:cytochrome c oxidase subunit 3